jgi:hypothetical protein
MHMTIATLVVFCLLPATGYAAEDSQVSIPYCDLLISPDSYDGKTIVTEAMVGSSFHSIAVYDTKCMSTAEKNRSASLELPEGWNSTRLGSRLSKLLRHKRDAVVKFEATFHSRGGAFGPEGTRFGFTLRRLFSVREAPKEGSS